MVELGLGFSGWRKGRVVWVLEVGEREGESEGNGTVRFTVAMLDVEAEMSVSVSSPLEGSGDLFLRGAWVAGPLATASLMWAGTRTQANVRS